MHKGAAQLSGGGGNFGSHGVFEEIISLSNLFRAWNEFKHGKIKKQDIAEFSAVLEESVFALHESLVSGSYRHGSYKSFHIYDPKRRHIHKALPIDRLLHHAIFRVLEPRFDPQFIFDSYSSRKGKGIHKAHARFREFARKLSRNNTKTVWVLKCDIRKFFDSVDHGVLCALLSKVIRDEKTKALMEGIIASFSAAPGKGIPLGNLTSQLFSNVYLDPFDQYVKRVLRVKKYIRYADDFVILDNDRETLLELLPKLGGYLNETLKLSMHPDKILIRKWNQGIDFLGYVIFPHHQVLRTKTKRRILGKIKLLSTMRDRGKVSDKDFTHTLASYAGLLAHCRGRGIGKAIEEIIKK